MEPYISVYKPLGHYDALRLHLANDRVRKLVGDTRLLLAWTL